MLEKEGSNFHSSGSKPDVLPITPFSNFSISLRLTIFMFLSEFCCITYIIFSRSFVGGDRIELPQHYTGVLQTLGFTNTQPTDFFVLLTGFEPVSSASKAGMLFRCTIGAFLNFVCGTLGRSRTHMCPITVSPG